MLWVIGQTVFPFQANGSLLKGPDGKAVGSKLIAQPFTKDEYFQPRPSAASYDASASRLHRLAASNYALRDSVARLLGPIAKYRSGPNAGKLVAPDIESWFQKDMFQGKPHIVAQWADLHGSLAQGWASDAAHASYIDSWAKSHADLVTRWIKDNPAAAQPKATDLAVLFFEKFSDENPGRFPSGVTHIGGDGKAQTMIESVKDGQDIQSIFCEMWREDHPDADLEMVPGDLVATSASGLDPHITLQNAEYQLDRVANTWAQQRKADPAEVRKEIAQLLDKNTSAPFGGLAGENMVNVLEVNLELSKRYGAP